MRFKKLLAAAVTAAMAAMMVVVPASAETLPTTGGEITSGEYTLTGDVILTDALIVPESAAVTIDLNGYTLTSVAEDSNVFCDVINNLGELIINGADESGTQGKIIGSRYGIRNYGTLTANNVSIEGQAVGEDEYGVYNYGVGIYNGEIDWNTDDITASGNATLTNCTIGGNLFGILNYDGTITLDSCNYDGSKGADRFIDNSGVVNITGAGELGPIDGSSQSDYGEVNVYNFTGSGLSIWQNIKLTATNSNIYAVTNLRNTFNVENCIIEEKFTTYYLTREITGSCVLKDVTINNADGGTTLYITNCEDVTIDNCTNDNGITSLIETDTTIIGGSHNNVEVQNNANVSISEATVGELRLTNDTATATVTSGTVDTITAGDSVTVENLIISGGTFGTTSIDRDTAEDIPLTYKETGTDNQYYILTDNTSTADLDGYKQSTGDNTYSQMYTFEEDLTSSNTVGFNITSTQDGERERNVTFGTANIEGITKLGLIVTDIPNGVTVDVQLTQ